METPEVEAHMLSRCLMHGDEEILQTSRVGGEVMGRGEVITVEEEEVVHGPVVESRWGWQHCQGLQGPEECFSCGRV